MKAGAMNRRGSAMIESALVTTSFLFLIIGIADFGRMGFAYNSIGYAAHRAARWASTRGSSSGHAAAAADIQAEVLANVAALDNTQLTTAVTWKPNNNPGNTVEVQVTYNFKALLIPITSSSLTLKCTSTQLITQ
jgi:Flp pilus assembly protein TadG